MDQRQVEAHQSLADDHTGACDECCNSLPLIYLLSAIFSSPSRLLFIQTVLLQSQAACYACSLYSHSHSVLRSDLTLPVLLRTDLLFHINNLAELFLIGTFLFIQISASLSLLLSKFTQFFLGYCMPLFMFAIRYV